MNIGRAHAWIMAAWLVFVVHPVAAGTPLAESTFQAWSGEMSEVVLPDGSVLFQYTSMTFSETAEGAMLGLSFLPRFHCAPTFYVRVRGSEESAVSEPVLDILFGGDTLKFAGFVDSEEGFVRYSVLASGEQMDELRQMLDASPRVTVVIDSESRGRSELQPDVGTGAGPVSNVANRIPFSLLGSRRAALSAQNHCLAHEPIAYQPR